MVGWSNKIFLIVLFLSIVLSLGAISFSEKTTDTLEKPSPGDWIKENQIKVYQDKVVLNVPNTIWATFTNTNSMDPFFDETAHAIEAIPQNANSINEGDVISYNTPFGVLIHRVISKKSDDQGIYYIVKGDNNSTEDPFKVRFKDVQGVVVAVIY